MSDKKFGDQLIKLCDVIRDAIVSWTQKEYGDLRSIVNREEQEKETVKCLEAQLRSLAIEKIIAEEMALGAIQAIKESQLRQEKRMAEEMPITNDDNGSKLTN
jgi:hypothetical protein